MAWFAVPHTALAYILVWRREQFPRAAVMTYAVFDIGASAYWVAPTAPPWYAGSIAGGFDDRERALRRMMVEYGEQTSGATAGGRSTVFLEVIPWLRCHRCTSPHP